MTSTLEKVAIVTGSTQGLGEAIARQPIAEQMIGGLVICGRNAANGQRLATEFGKLGCRTEFVVADLARVEDCRAVVEHGPAGLPTRGLSWSTAPQPTDRGTILDTSPELYDRIMAVNVRARFS